MGLLTCPGITTVMAPDDGDPEAAAPKPSLSRPAPRFPTQLPRTPSENSTDDQQTGRASDGSGACRSNDRGTGLSGARLERVHAPGSLQDRLRVHRGLPLRAGSGGRDHRRCDRWRCREPNRADSAQNQPGPDVAAAMGPETRGDAIGSTTAETGPEATFTPDAASPDTLQIPDAPSPVVDLAPTVDAPSLGSDATDAPVDSSIPADTAPAGSPPGFACMGASDCASGKCSDGVCCDSDCKGACQSCALAGKVGTCSYVTGSPVPAHPACGGIGTCAGSCNGRSASCFYPDTKTVCGTARCTNGMAYPAPACDGAGTCGSPQSTPCGQFACGTTSCLSVCSDSSQCVAGAACVGSKCVQCAVGETACPNTCANLQTDNSHCGSCSGTGSACSTTQQCSGGKCLLATGQPCTADAECGVGKCAFFYVDNDHDGYPDSQVRSGWCGATYALAADFVAPRTDGKWDCCDGDILVHPDQAQYFAVPSARCSVGFDYDCSGAIEKQPMAGSVSCAFDANQVCGSATGTPSEACGSLHRAGECEAVTTVSPPLCVSTASMVSGTVGCH